VANLGGGDDLGLKTAPFKPERSTFGGRRYHGAFFYGHGYGKELSVYLKIGGHAVGRVKITDGVLDKLIVKLLDFGLGMPVMAQKSPGLFPIVKILIRDPFDFGFLGKLRKAFDGLRHEMCLKIFFSRSNFNPGGSFLLSIRGLKLIQKRS